MCSLTSRHGGVICSCVLDQAAWEGQFSLDEEVNVLSLEVEECGVGK